MQKQNDPSSFLIASDAARATIAATRRLEENLAAIEGLLESGISRRGVMDLLNENGFSFTLNSFASALQRARRRNTVRPLEPVKNEGSVAESVGTEKVRAQPTPIKEPRKFVYDIYAPTEWKRAETKGET